MCVCKDVTDFKPNVKLRIDNQESETLRTLRTRQGVVVLLYSVCSTEDTLTLIARLYTRTNLVQDPTKIRMQKHTMFPNSVDPSITSDISSKNGVEIFCVTASTSIQVLYYILDTHTHSVSYIILSGITNWRFANS